MATVKVDPAAVAAFLRSSDGPVLRRFIILGDKVKAATINSLKPGFPREFLGPTIVKRITLADNGPHVLVGSEKVQTRPHIIRGNPYLAFHWERVGRFMIVRSVNHPGSNFEKYLTERLLHAVDTVRSNI